MYMKVLLTGAFGNVGLSALSEILGRGFQVRLFELPTPANRKAAKRYGRKVEIIWGDLRNFENVEEAVRGQDVILHVGAIIPPLAYREPVFSEAVNVGGTRNILEAMKLNGNSQKLVFTSSVAVYGDRRDSPHISIDDELSPSAGDCYAEQKIVCENLIRRSNQTWCIFRLSYIVSMNKLQMDPMMFRVPLDTPIEICDTKDVGLALANSVENENIWGGTFHISGGPECRTTFREYLDNMMDIFGLGRKYLPDTAFTSEDFHCGYMTTRKGQELLNYQRYSLDSYYEDVRKKVGWKKHLVKLTRPVARKYLLAKSPYYTDRYRRKPAGEGS